MPELSHSEDYYTLSCDGIQYKHFHKVTTDS